MVYGQWCQGLGLEAKDERRFQDGVTMTQNPEPREKHDKENNKKIFT